VEGQTFNAKLPFCIDFEMTSETKNPEATNVAKYHGILKFSAAHKDQWIQGEFADSNEREGIGGPFVGMRIRDADNFWVALKQQLSTLQDKLQEVGKDARLKQEFADQAVALKSRSSGKPHLLIFVAKAKEREAM